MRFKYLIASLLLVMSICIIPTSILAFNMEVDVNMASAFNHLYSGGMRAEYDIGTALPSDDVRAKASKSLEAYSGKYVYVSVNLKNANGRYDYKFNSSDSNGSATWLTTGWTDEKGGSDTAESVTYNFNGYTIHYK